MQRPYIRFVSLTLIIAAAVVLLARQFAPPVTGSAALPRENTKEIRFFAY